VTPVDPNEDGHLVGAVLDNAEEALEGLEGHVVDVVSIRKPNGEDEILGWLLTISKLLPLVGNMLEVEFVRRFNQLDLPDEWTWERQDPGFPGAGLKGLPGPTPGIEIKAWFPLATEITGRFWESQRRLSESDVRVAAILANWPKRSHD
jgi:hypothetical protein